MQNAADALEKGDIAAAQAALNNAADQIAQTGQAPPTQNAVSGVLGDLERDQARCREWCPADDRQRDPATAQRHTEHRQCDTWDSRLPDRGDGTPGRPNGSPGAGNGTAVAGNGTPVTINGTPVSVNGTPVQGTPPPNATPVVGQGQGQGQGARAKARGRSRDKGNRARASKARGKDKARVTTRARVVARVPGRAARSRMTRSTRRRHRAARPASSRRSPVRVADSPPTGTTQGQGVNTPSGVPYNQVYEQYRDQALQGIDDPNIPPELREYIRQYFSNIDPSKPQNQP